MCDERPTGVRKYNQNGLRKRQNTTRLPLKMPSWLLFVSHSAELSHKLDLQANVTLKMHIFPLKNKLMIIMYVSLNKARGNAYAAIIYLHLLLWIS